jgi:type IV pilus assembly protein PilW
MSAMPMHRRSHMSGMTLIELMVALGIGAFLMMGAMTVFMQSRTTFRITESVSRMQENGRFALDAMEPDIRMAHYYGLTALVAKISNAAGPTDAAGPGPNTCGNNWTIDFRNSIGGTNGVYSWGCLPTAGFQAGSDTLVVRRVTENVMPPAAGFMSIQSARYQDSTIFIGAVVPTAIEYLPGSSATHRMVVNGYYISPNSTLNTAGNAVPALRRKELGIGPAITDNEVLAGVQDMQIQFGIDTDLIGAPGRGVVDRYVNAGDPLITPGNAAYIPTSEILAVRIWLLVRAERVEPGFTDTTNYVYADRNITPNDGFRRSLVSKTIYLRNARPPE